MLYNYHFVPTAESIEGTKIEIQIHENPITIVIKAETPEEAAELGRSIINMQNWVLSQTSDIQ